MVSTTSSRLCAREKGRSFRLRGSRRKRWRPRLSLRTVEARMLPRKLLRRRRSRGRLCLRRCRRLRRRRGRSRNDRENSLASLDPTKSDLVAKFGGFAFVRVWCRPNCAPLKRGRLHFFPPAHVFPETIIIALYEC